MTKNDILNYNILDLLNLSGMYTSEQESAIEINMLLKFITIKLKETLTPEAFSEVLRKFEEFSTELVGDFDTEKFRKDFEEFMDSIFKEQGLDFKTVFAEYQADFYVDFIREYLGNLKNQTQLSEDTEVMKNKRLEKISKIEENVGQYEWDKVQSGLIKYSSID